MAYRIGIDETTLRKRRRAIKRTILKAAQSSYYCVLTSFLNIGDVLTDMTLFHIRQFINPMLSIQVLKSQSDCSYEDNVTFTIPFLRLHVFHRPNKSTDLLHK